MSCPKGGPHDYSKTPAHIAGDSSKVKCDICKFMKFVAPYCSKCSQRVCAVCDGGESGTLTKGSATVFNASKPKPNDGPHTPVNQG